MLCFTLFRIAPFVRKHNKKFKQDIDSCFYPLDNTNIYNLYGKNGFIQIQILIEENNPEIIIDKILVYSIPVSAYLSRYFTNSKLFNFPSLSL